MVIGEGLRPVSPCRETAARGRRAQRCWWLVPLVAVSVPLALLPLPAGARGSPWGPIRSYRELRYTGVVGQTTWYTCGPAVLATLLKHYYHMDTSEEEMLFLATGSRETKEEKDKAGHDEEDGVIEGVSMLELKKALEKKGIDSKGFRVTLDQLVDYFHRGGLPLVLHVTKPRLHYVLGVGMLPGGVVLADPSFGTRFVSLRTLMKDKGFSGNVLVPIPGPREASAARDRQREVLRDSRARLSRLGTVRNLL